MPDDPSTPESGVPGWSRYQRVKQILDKASGDAHPSYQGNDRFWNLPHAAFLEVVIYGIRMIAPPGRAPSTGAPDTSCCHGQADPAIASGSDAGRGAASGLIKGLKGQPPFDGSQFPRLPWGGSPVADADIDFIERWIDDGAPERDAPLDGAAPGGADHVARLRALASGDTAHPRHTGPLNRFHDDTGGVKVRKNIDCLGDEELARFRNAVARMKSLDQYEQDERSFGYWGRVHGNQCQHSWEQFLTWHRAFLYFFEQQLQDVDPTVTLPYWDWASYREDLELSIADMSSTAALDNGIIPEAYRCWIDQAGLNQLQAQGVPQAVLDKLAAKINQKYDSGNRLFLDAGITWGDNPTSDRAIIAVLEKINPLWHYQRWPGGNSNIIFEAYPRPDDVERILELDDFFSFASGPADNHFFGALENLHNLIHNFSGGINPNFGSSTEPLNIDNPAAGDMVNAGRTAFDPIFWGHHTNCDRLWAEWQKRHTNGGPDDPDDILPPWNMTVGDTYDTAKLGYQYMQSSHVFPASTALPIARFVSADADVHPKVTATHRRAEVRLHGVRYSTRAGFYIRVFLNQPDAVPTTPTDGNPNYVGMLNMFTGLCIGGPGHCEPPASTRRRKFDHRPRHHKTPAAFRIDATAAVARLKAAGATDFQVTLVVLNLDGSLATDALLFDGVSLNFYD